MFKEMWPSEIDELAGDDERQVVWPDDYSFRSLTLVLAVRTFWSRTDGRVPQQSDEVPVAAFNTHIPDLARRIKRFRMVTSANGANGRQHLSRQIPEGVLASSGVESDNCEFDTAGPADRHGDYRCRRTSTAELINEIVIDDRSVSENCCPI